jgi:hypothetical protein
MKSNLSCELMTVKRYKNKRKKQNAGQKLSKISTTSQDPLRIIGRGSISEVTPLQLNVEASSEQHAMDKFCSV